MTFWNIYTLVIIILYLTAFFLRNLKTYFSTKKSIRGKSAKLTLSLVFSTIIYLVVILLILQPEKMRFIFEIKFLDHSILKYFGYAFIFIALLAGLAALFEMRNSWRVGIKHDQKTELVTTGIYSFSRNPYFLSYDLLFLGLFLIYPSLILLALIIGLAFIFHMMILEEEQYLEKIQGEYYLQYKNKVARYLFHF
jgi:protein-S-isoprenylcysteine O-methyltransferase Ste14